MLFTPVSGGDLPRAPNLEGPLRPEMTKARPFLPKCQPIRSATRCWHELWWIWHFVPAKVRIRSWLVANRADRRIAMMQSRDTSGMPIMRVGIVLQHGSDLLDIA